MYILSPYIFYFGQKDPFKVRILALLSALVKICQSTCHFPSKKLVFLQILDRSWTSWKITPLYFFSSNNIYFAQKDPIKENIFGGFWLLRWKFVKFLLSILKRQVDSSPNFVFLFNFMKDNSSVLFWAQKIYTLLKWSPLKGNFLRLLSARVNNPQFRHVNLKWQVNSSWNFVSFFIAITDNSSVEFKLILFQLWIKGSHQNPNFETFKCSDGNLSYSSSHFPNYKSVESNVI